VIQSLHFNLTYRCNLRCRFCVTGGSQPDSDMPLDVLRRELLRGREQGVTNINLCGGEPTVYPHVVELVSCAHDLGIERICLKTNGYLLKDHGFVDELVAAGVNHFSISLHGPAEVHDSLTGVEGSFAAAARGIERIRHHGSYLSLPTCIMRPNYHLLPQTVSMLADFEPNVVMPTFTEPKGRGDANFDDVMATYDEVYDSLCRALDLLIAREVPITLVNFPFCAVRGYERLSRDTHNQVTHLVHDDGSFMEDLFSIERRTIRVKGEHCRRCNFEVLCLGPFRTYIERRGWGGLLPITDLRLLDVVPLSVILRSELAAARGGGKQAGEGAAGGAGT